VVASTSPPATRAPPRPANRTKRLAFGGSKVRRHLLPRPESLHGFGRSRARTHAGAYFEFPAHPASPSGRRGVPRLTLRQEGRFLLVTYACDP